MGTRSTVKFKDNDNIILSVYQQFDGYPQSVGLELAEFLASKTLVNGYNSDQENGQYANGAGCLAAQYVAANKTGIGGFYLTNPQDEQEYNYEVHITTNLRKFNVHITCYNHKEQLFSGNIEEFLEFCKKD